MYYAKLERGPAWTNVSSSSFTGWDETNKPVWDPCPAGWRVASKADLAALFQDGTSSPNGKLPNGNIKNFETRDDDGGYLLYFQQLSSGHSSYFRFTGYGRAMNTFEFIGELCSIATRSKVTSEKDYMSYSYWFNVSDAYKLSTTYQSDAHPLRCVQEKAD